MARALREPVDRQTSARRRKSSVDAFREQIGEWLQQGLSGVRMLELAREDPEHRYGGRGSVWRAAVRRERLSLLHEQAVADVPIRFEGSAGRQRVLRPLLACDVLVLDELGYLPILPGFGPALYELIVGQYERRPTLIASNESLSIVGSLCPSRVDHRVRCLLLSSRAIYSHLHKITHARVR